MHFPGSGVGGHCLPKDSWLLLYGYKKYSDIKKQYPLSILEDARHLNDWMPLHVVDLLETALKSINKELKGTKISVLGYAFLENSDDARNTPTTTLLKELANRGAKFAIHDPFVKNITEFKIETDLDSVLKDSDALVLMTKHDIYKTITPDKLSSFLSSRVIIDGRNVFDPDMFEKEGFIFAGIGKGKSAKNRSKLS
jgi:UDP-N-acetyl-D-mannosaminuronic acid dehydrogenase